MNIRNSGTNDESRPGINREAPLDNGIFGPLTGWLGISVFETAPPAGLREKLLSRVEGEKNNPRNETAEPTHAVTLYAGEGKWKPLGEGVFVKMLFVDQAKKTMTSLVKLLPGAKLPAHRHRAVEQCFILEGDYSVNGKVLRPGDFHCALPGSLDQELYSAGGTVFLLVAPVHYEPLDPSI